MLDGILDLRLEYRVVELAATERVVLLITVLVLETDARTHHFVIDRIDDIKNGLEGLNDIDGTAGQNG